MNRWARIPLLACLILLFSACQNTQDSRIIYTGAPLPTPAPEPEPEPVESEAIRRARMLADLLYEARLAYEDNRLMTPASNNAYDRYRTALDIDPGNAVALQGLVDIALRYGELATVAINQGQYDNAANLLARGERVQPGREELALVRQRLEQAGQNETETFALDPAGLDDQSLELLTQLGEIAQHIRNREATFLINARSDAEGRWIYRIMREAVGGYRLRGNIALSGTPSIIVTVAPATH